MTPDIDDLDRAIQAPTGERLLHLLGSVGSTGDEKGSGPYLLVDLGGVFGRLREVAGGDSLLGEAASELSPESSTASSDSTADAGGRRRLPRFLLVGTLAGVGYAFRRQLRGFLGGERAESVLEGAPTPPMLEGSEAAFELPPWSSEEAESDQASGGRWSRARTALGLGAVLGVAYALFSRRSSKAEEAEPPAESPEEAAEAAAEETESLAREAATVIQRRGELVAERIEAGTEAIAERIEYGGEEAAEQITGAAESIEEDAERTEDLEGDVAEDAESPADVEAGFEADVEADLGERDAETETAADVDEDVTDDDEEE